MNKGQHLDEFRLWLVEHRHMELPQVDLLEAQGMTMNCNLN
jgi:hypothetical protein